MDLEDDKLFYIFLLIIFNFIFIFCLNLYVKQIRIENIKEEQEEEILEELES